MFSALGSVATRKWRAGLLWKRVERFEAVRDSMRALYRVPSGETEKLGVEDPARKQDVER